MNYIEAICQEIAGFAELEADWNDEGAVVIDARCIQVAQQYVQQEAAALTITEANIPDTCPLIDGGVGLYWSKRNEEYRGQCYIQFRPGDTEPEIMLFYHKHARTPEEKTAVLYGSGRLCAPHGVLKP